jgi:hypothetical protein
MRLIIDTTLLFLAFPFWTPGASLPNSSGTTAEVNITVGFRDLSSPATTSGWTDLYGGTIGRGAKSPFGNELDSYPGDSMLSSARSDRNSLDQVDASVNRDKPGNIAGVTAIVVLIGALRLYFTSLSFRKLLFDTFSPLSPLGY